MVSDEHNRKMLGNRLRHLRNLHKYSLDKVGSIVGLSGSVIGRIERGVNNPSILLLKQLSELYNVSIDYLVIGESDPEECEYIKKQSDELLELIYSLPEEKQEDIREKLIQFAYILTDKQRS